MQAENLRGIIFWQTKCMLSVAAGGNMFSPNHMN